MKAVGGSPSFWAKIAARDGVTAFFDVAQILLGDAKSCSEIFLAHFIAVA